MGKEIQNTNLVFKELIVHNDVKLLRESAYRIREKHFPKMSTTTNETNTKGNAIYKHFNNIQRKVILDKQEYLKTSWISINQVKLRF